MLFAEIEDWFSGGTARRIEAARQEHRASGRLAITLV
jgi:hypothetical protein